jgi:hypothetical protein
MVMDPDSGIWICKFECEVQVCIGSMVPTRIPSLGSFGLRLLLCVNGNLLGAVHKMFVTSIFADSVVFRIPAKSMLNGSGLRDVLRRPYLIRLI